MSKTLWKLVTIIRLSLNFDTLKKLKERLKEKGDCSLNKKMLLFIISVLLLFVYGWFVKTYDPNFMGLLAGTFIYTSIIQILFTRWGEKET